MNPTYRDPGAHYGVANLPARPYRAWDKAKAEVGVQAVQRWIVTALRKRKFFSLEEVNQAIAELLVGLNQRPFPKRVTPVALRAPSARAQNQNQRKLRRLKTKKPRKSLDGCRSLSHTEGAPRRFAPI